MASRDDLPAWIVKALEQLGGSGTPVEVAREIWQVHEHDLRASGALFFTWQYDMRWAATKLRLDGRLEDAAPQEAGRWRLRAASRLPGPEQLPLPGVSAA